MYVFKSPHKEHNRSVVTMRSNSILIMFIVAAVQEACEVNASSMFIPWLGDLVVEAQESTQAQATASGTASHSNSGTSDETQVSMTKGSSRISDSAAGEWSMVSPWLMEFQLSSVSRKPLPYVPRRCKQNESTWLVHSFKRQGHWYNSIDWVANWLIQHSKSQCKVWHSTRRWSMLFPFTDVWWSFWSSEDGSNDWTTGETSSSSLAFPPVLGATVSFLDLNLYT